MIFRQVPLLGVVRDQVIYHDENTDESQGHEQRITAISRLASGQRIAGALRVQQDKQRQANDQDTQADLDRKGKTLLDNRKAGSYQGRETSQI